MIKKIKIFKNNRKIFNKIINFKITKTMWTKIIKI